MAETLTPFDPANYLDTPEMAQAYLDDACETNDPAFIARAMGDVARARNLTELARVTGLTRQGLGKALSGSGNPTLETVLKVAEALGVTLRLGKSPADQKTQRAPAARRATRTTAPKARSKTRLKSTASPSSASRA